MRSLTQFPGIAVMAAFPAACGDRAGAPQQASTGKSAVVPKQYTVADFYKNGGIGDSTGRLAEL